MAALLREELDPYRVGDAVSMEGPETILDPRRAQTLALAVHELATNAAKYGALSSSSGKVKLIWKDDENGLTIQWLEAGGPKVRAPDTQGYGTRVIRASLEQLGGRASLRLAAHGVTLQPVAAPRWQNQTVGRDDVGSGVRPPRQRSSFEAEARAPKNVLLVEDESMVAMMVEQVLAEFGLSVVGPYGTIDDAMRAASEISLDAAILDINLDGQSVYPVVDLLMANGCPDCLHQWLWGRKRRSPL